MNKKTYYQVIVINGYSREVVSSQLFTDEETANMYMEDIILEYHDWMEDDQLFQHLENGYCDLTSKLTVYKAEATVVK